MTFAEWRSLVKIAYQGGEPAQAALLRAVVDGARAIVVRDVESDLPLAKSYRDSYRELKAGLAGTRITADLAATITSARAIMTIDADTSAATVMVDNAIETAYNDVNGVADRWDALLVEAAIEMQRHVSFFHHRQITTYLSTTDGVTNEGFVSKVDLPDTCRVQQLWYGPYYPPLEQDTSYEVDDIVISNGRAYKVTTAGQLTIYEIGDGLTSTDGSEETLGEMTFTYYAPERDWPVRQTNWYSRNRVFSGDYSGGPAYAQAPQNDEIWMYPKLDADHRFDLEWVGVAETFEDDDEVTFDRKAAACAAHFLRSHLTRELLGDLKTSEQAFALFQRDLRGLVVDNEQREQGIPGDSAPYDYRRRCRAGCFGGILSINSNNSDTTVINPNDYAAVFNEDGDSTMTSLAANMVFDLTLGGSARTSNFILPTTGRLPGDRVVVRVLVPATAGIELAFRTGSVGGALLLPVINFPSQTWTTPGDNAFTATFEFELAGSAWAYLRSNIPS